jgi:V8-like Glu-specific endopeptidase
MRRPLLALAAALTALAGVVPMQANPASAGPGSDNHGRTVAYWTPARRAAAIPRNIERDPKAKPGGGGSGSTKVTGAAWTGGGDVTMTTGKVFFTSGGIDWVCSGSAVHSSHGNAVLTAGHCVNDGDGAPFATRWIFYPGWNGSPSPTLGAWTATSLFTTRNWATNEDFDDDAGFAVVTNGTSATLEGVLTGPVTKVPTIAFDGPSTTQTYSAFGYPAAGKYKGNTLTYCAGQVQISYDGGQTLALPCDMTGGSSGGPWLVDYGTGARVIESLNSYGYSGLRAMFGPIFGPAEQAAYQAASSGSCSTSTAYACTGL